MSEPPPKKTKLEDTEPKFLQILQHEFFRARIIAYLAADDFAHQALLCQSLRVICVTDLLTFQKKKGGEGGGRKKNKKGKGKKTGGLKFWMNKQWNVWLNQRLTHKVDFDNTTNFFSLYQFHTEARLQQKNYESEVIEGLPRHEYNWIKLIKKAKYWQHSTKSLEKQIVREMASDELKHRIAAYKTSFKAMCELGTEGSGFGDSDFAMMNPRGMKICALKEVLGNYND